MRNCIYNYKFKLNEVRRYYSKRAKSSATMFLSPVFKPKEFLNLGYSKSIFTYSSKSQEKLVSVLSELIMDEAKKRNFKIRSFLDIACGLGGPAIYLAGKYGIHVDGIDISDENLEKANLNVIKYKMGNLVKLKLANALNLPFNPNTFDACWIIESPHIPNRGRLIKEISRIIKPNGIYLFTDLFANFKNIEKSEENFKYYKQFLEIWSIPYLLDFNSYTKLLESNGFDVFHQEDITKYNLSHMKKLAKFGVFLIKTGILPRFVSYYSKRYKIPESVVRKSLIFVTNTYEVLKRDLVRYGIICSSKVSLDHRK